MTRRTFALCIVALTFALAGVARAADDKKAPYEGTWKWTVSFNNNTREQTMKLKTEDGKPKDDAKTDQDEAKSGDKPYRSEGADGKLYDRQGVEVRECPECGHNMYQQGRTWTCENCGYSYVE